MAEYDFECRNYTKTFIAGGSDINISKVSCRQVTELVGDYVDGALPKSRHECVDRHIERCAACEAFINTYKATVSAVNRLGALGGMMRRGGDGRPLRRTM
jgi:hypothetical protein